MSDRAEVTGMVLSSTPVGDYDKRIVLLTKERGKISGFAKGARRQNSQMMAPSQPFAFGVFELYEGRSANTFYSAQISNYFDKLKMDLEAAYLGMYFLEFADYYARENNDERELLKLLYVTMRALEKGIIGRKLIRYIFELRAMMINGEYPDVFRCVSCRSEEDLAGFDHDRNGVLCSSCLQKVHGWKLMPPTIYAMQYILGVPVEKLYSFELDADANRELAYVVDRFRNKIIDKHFKTLDFFESLQI